MVRVQPRLGEGIQPLGCHHAAHSPGDGMHVAQLSQEERRAHEPYLQVGWKGLSGPLGEANMMQQAWSLLCVEQSGEELGRLKFQKNINLFNQQDERNQSVPDKERLTV